MKARGAVRARRPSRPAPVPRVADPDLVLQLGPERLAVFAESLVEHNVRLRVDIIDLHAVQYTVARALHAAGLGRDEAIARGRSLVRAALLRLADDDTSYIPSAADAFCECDSPFDDVMTFEGG